MLGQPSLLTWAQTTNQKCGPSSGTWLGTDPTPLPGQALKSGGHNFQTPQEKADLFLDRFSSVHPRNIADNRHFEAAIRNKIRSRTTDPLNDAFTQEELDKAMPRSKRNATGPDLIQNKMIRNLSKPNKTSLLHLFNRLFTNTHVPTQWNNAVVIPLL
ncbi:hypothetical protein DAPPUDRAFT_261169 [Daphnia pulex]|uniref:Uncharacterized protein n=1 Tax=Daphnia pulex TaxID=6669 RepID=E9HKL9_DAPPU|nr:hypothetical protein DAPPUDRAFT_261169 [Daphnia pulex]|eukprot:EFX67713.1 hypothetical protein DAPPUDRAFT_261169 [Daphnia pulex]